MLLKKLYFYLQLFFSDDWSRASVYRKYLGIEIGEGVRILHFPRFGSEPYLIKIGNNVTITRGVAFVNHDGGVALFRNEIPGLNIYGRIEIGNNVFIGINSIILKDVKIGDNVVIGAGSIVSKNVPDNVVVAGIPAKIISTIEEYKAKVIEKGFALNESNPKTRKSLILEYVDTLSVN